MKNRNDTSLKKVLLLIRKSCFKSLKGEENYLVVLLGWGIFVYVFSITMGFLSVKAVIVYGKIGLPSVIADVLSIPMNMLGMMGVILVFIYPLLLAIALTRSSLQYGYILRLLNVLVLAVFFTFHYVLSLHIILFGSLMLMRGSKFGFVAMLLLIAFVLYRILKQPLTKKSKYDNRI